MPSPTVSAASFPGRLFPVSPANVAESLSSKTEPVTTPTGGGSSSDAIDYGSVLGVYQRLQKSVASVLSSGDVAARKICLAPINRVLDSVRNGSVQIPVQGLNDFTHDQMEKVRASLPSSTQFHYEVGTGGNFVATAIIPLDAIKREAEHQQLLANSQQQQQQQQLDPTTKRVSSLTARQTPYFFVFAVFVVLLGYWWCTTKFSDKMELLYTLFPSLRDFVASQMGVATPPLKL